MIARLKGLLDSTSADACVIDVNGVGYLVSASVKTLGALGGTGAAVALHIETQVREDAIQLFGFLTEAERDSFRLLTTVQGVGGRVALAILSVLGPNELAHAIAAADTASIARANGVGPKLAARPRTPGRTRPPGTWRLSPRGQDRPPRADTRWPAGGRGSRQR